MSWIILLTGFFPSNRWGSEPITNYCCSNKEVYQFCLFWGKGKKAKQKGKKGKKARAHFPTFAFFGTLGGFKIEKKTLLSRKRSASFEEKKRFFSKRSKKKESSEGDASFFPCFFYTHFHVEIEIYSFL